MESESRKIVGFLSDEKFESVVENTPLVSIDLIVRGSDGTVLLGCRTNPPAKDYWFVQGGRIRKNESFKSAFSRLVTEELNLEFEIENAKYLGLYEHFYEDSIFTDESNSVSTHYAVNAFEISVNLKDLFLPIKQHSQYCWFSVSELLENSEVHKHTKWYFDKEKGFI